MSGNPERSEIKEAVAAQSGRFEYFKQMLTLSLAAIAGLAAILTDPDKVPTDSKSKFTIAILGLALVVTATTASMGISTYANFLRALHIKNQGPVSLKHRQTHDANWFEGEIVGHAWVTFYASGLAVIALLAFGTIKLFFQPSLSPDAALELTRLLVGKETGQPSQAILLDHLEANRRDFLITYRVVTSGTIYILRVARDTKEIREISREKPLQSSGGMTQLEEQPKQGLQTSEPNTGGNAAGGFNSSFLDQTGEGAPPSGSPVIAGAFKIYGPGPNTNFSDLAKAITAAAAKAGPKHVQEVIEGIGAAIDDAKKAVGLSSDILDFYRKVWPRNDELKPPAALPQGTLLDIQAKFAFNSAELDHDTVNALRALAEKLRGDHSPVLIEGHADGVGTSAVNLTLSRRRAEAVGKFLVENGVSPTQLRTYGYGQGYFWLPYVPAAAANRRVRIVECTVAGLDRCTQAAGMVDPPNSAN